MSASDPLLPKSTVPGLIPTLNHTGWMTEGLDRVSQGFVDYAGTCDAEVLDIGCAYGVATLPALAAGARVLAADMEQRHLEILVQRVPPAQRVRLRTQHALMPGVDFEPGRFGAILCARALHFLKPMDAGIAVLKMSRWLVPGGRLFLVTDSPYVGPWYRRAPLYEQRKAEGCPWPGYVENYREFLPPGVDPAQHTDFINPMDPDILARVCRGAQLDVLDASWLRNAMDRPIEKAHAGVIARRP
jgi:SAM-dependent methyltransferase